ncbi:MAG TPA: molybdenum cofactor guanylyltransferase MobA [Burkholderiaceae bacterium]|nr:molybdenum cofactor guanylyltransferase MobA [Burkholderiaceae bacterium]
MIAREDITGVVLAGGLGRRMSEDSQGVDKGLQLFRGRPMVAHAIDRLAPQVGTILVNANQNLETYRAFGWPVIPDALGGFAGPLAGLASAMQAARTPWVLTVPCDSPLFPADLAARLAGAADAAGTRVAVVRTTSGDQPVFLLAHTALASDLQAFLAAGRRKIDAWYGPLSPAVVDFADESAFRNINTRDELRSLE